MPNEIGSTFRECSWTDLDGMRLFEFVPTGPRSISVEPPEGFSVASEGATRDVNVLKGTTSIVVFELVRNQQTVQ
jgi:hypothetical protein